MGAREPILGYPSKTAAALAFSAQGLNVRQIAAKMELPVCNVSALLCSAARTKVQRDVRVLRIRLRDRTFSLLEREAEIRGRSAQELALDLLDAITEDDLINAVLDDAFRDELEAAE